MVSDSPSPSETPDGGKTILDLKANKVEPARDEVIDPASEPVDTAFVEESAVEEAAAERLAAEETKADAAASASAWAGTRSDETPSDETRSAYTTSSDTFAHTSPTPATTHGHSSGAMIGAGILGGLVALALAGSMQYAGYLPGVSSTPAPAATDTAEVASLRSEVDGLKQQLAGIPTDLTPSADVEKRIAALEAGAGKQGADPEQAAKMQALEERLAALDAKTNRVESAGSQQLAALTTRLSEAEKTLEEQPGEAAVSRAIAATYLKAAVDRGAPFLTELETFAALAPEDPAVAELKPMAATGVKSKTELAEMFNDTARAALEAVNQPVAGESMADRLLSSARTLISVRPVGNVEGADAGAILARMEDKLKNGDVKGAALEWDGLPDPAKKATPEFKAALDKRAKADELTRGLAERSATPAVNAG